MFVATLRGRGVWHDCVLFRTISNTEESTLDALSKEISSQYRVDVSDFHINHGVLEAYTSREDVKVFIEEVSPL